MQEKSAVKKPDAKPQDVIRHGENPQNRDNRQQKNRDRGKCAQQDNRLSKTAKPKIPKQKSEKRTKTKKTATGKTSQGRVARRRMAENFKKRQMGIFQRIDNGNRAAL
ncbi:MAG: hypothetical protein L6V85_10220 [Clostridiales bacterium]|nr:MAG: hypothetical protein L6V85_10220 [Clostridiales bacterium]